MKMAIMYSFLGVAVSLDPRRPTSEPQSRFVSMRPAWASLPPPPAHVVARIVRAMLHVEINTLVRQHRRVLLAALESEGWDPSPVLRTRGLPYSEERRMMIRDIVGVVHGWLVVAEEGGVDPPRTSGGQGV